MKRALRWVVDYWYIPLFAVVVIAAWVLWARWNARPSLPPVQKILGEVKAIGAAREAREIQIKGGAEEAKRHVREKYAERRLRLDAEAEAKAKELENDPVALARYLDRVSG